MASDRLVATVRSAVVQLECADRECEVAERLRGVPELTSRHGVPFLTEQADVVAQGEQAPEQRPRLRVMSFRVQRVDRPEGAGEEDSFAGGQSVVREVRAVAEHEAVLGDLALDRVHGAFYGVHAAAAPIYLLGFAVGNLLGPLTLPAPVPAT